MQALNLYLSNTLNSCVQQLGLHRQTTKRISHPLKVTNSNEVLKEDSLNGGHAPESITRQGRESYISVSSCILPHLGL